MPAVALSTVIYAVELLLTVAALLRPLAVPPMVLNAIPGNRLSDEGGHRWLVQPVLCDLPQPLSHLRADADMDQMRELRTRRAAHALDLLCHGLIVGYPPARFKITKM
jgi:hypothetical protein